MRELINQFLSSPIKIISVVVIIMSTMYMSFAINCGFADFWLAIFIPTVFFLALLALSIDDPVIPRDKIPQIVLKSVVGAVCAALTVKSVTPASNFSYTNVIILMPLYFLITFAVAYKKEIYVMDKKST